VQRLVRNDERGLRQCGWRDPIEHILREGDAVKGGLGDGRCGGVAARCAQSGKREK
jgi:hypothetical protein